jgi:hypothetical protein
MIAAFHHRFALMSSVLFVIAVPNVAQNSGDRGPNTSAATRRDQIYLCTLSFA